MADCRNGFLQQGAPVAPGSYILLCANIMNFEQQFWRTANSFEQRVKSIGVLLLIFCALYFVELGSFSLSIDEEVGLFGPHGRSWIIQGRWGAYLVEKFILTRPILPFLPHLVFGLACVVSFLLILEALRVGPRLGFAEYGSFAVFCGFPTWFFISEFSTNIGAVGIGLVGSTLSVCLASNSLAPSAPRRAAIVAAVALGAFSIAIYQTFLLYMVALALGLGFLLPQGGPHRADAIRSGITLLIIAGGCLAYLAGDGAFKWWFGLRSAYVNTFFDPGYFFSDPFTALKKMLRELRRVYGISSRFYTILLWTVPALLAVGVAAIAARSTGWTRRQRAVVAVAAILILVTPFGLNLFGEVRLPLRALVAVPVVVWAFTYLGLTSTDCRIRALSAVTLFFAIFQFLTLHNTMHALNVLVAKHDLLLAASMQERVSALPGFGDQPVYPLAVYGGRSYPTPYPVPPSSTSGNSFFGWDGGNPMRIAYYLNAVGLTQVRIATPAEMAQSVEELSRMPVWPAPGSVALSSGVLLVRLGVKPNPFNQPR